MSLAMILSCFWIVVATIVAFLPMRHQFAPGLTLLLLAPVLLFYLSYQQGIWVGLIGILAVASIFRRPLFYYLGKYSGRTAGANEKNGQAQ